MTTKIHISDIKTAITYWQNQLKKQCINETSSPQLQALLEIDEKMTTIQSTEIEASQLSEFAMDGWMQWYESLPDAPCIAICSTTQGDEVCKGCGRTFKEVQNWIGMTPFEKRLVWRRITTEGTSWRFNRYKERAVENFS